MSSASEPDAPAFYTVKEVAALLRVHRMTVYRLLHDGKLPYQCFGRRTFRIPVAAYEAYVAASAAPVVQA